MEVRVDTLEEAMKLIEEGIVTSWVLSPEAYYTIANHDPSRMHLDSFHSTLLGLPFIVKPC